MFEECSATWIIQVVLGSVAQVKCFTFKLYKVIFRILLNIPDVTMSGLMLTVHVVFKIYKGYC